MKDKALKELTLAKGAKKRFFFNVQKKRMAKEVIGLEMRELTD